MSGINAGVGLFLLFAAALNMLVYWTLGDAVHAFIAIIDMATLWLLVESSASQNGEEW